MIQLFPNTNLLLTTYHDDTDAYDKFNIAKLKIKPISGPVGFLYFLSVPDPSGNYLVYANLALTIKNVMYN